MSTIKKSMNSQFSSLKKADDDLKRGLEKTDLYDLYRSLKLLHQQLEMIKVQEDSLQRELISLNQEIFFNEAEVRSLQSIPMIVGHFLESIDQNSGIVSSTDGYLYYVRILSTIDRELLKPLSCVALHKKSNICLGVLPESDSTVFPLEPGEKPDITYSDIGGLDMQKQEVREAVELPLTHLDLYKRVGIEPPKGVLLYGPPGCGKTMLARAVAHHTTATFIPIAGSSFMQKYLGEGPRMVRDLFRLARENAPAIIFIDDIDAIAYKRSDSKSDTDREAQRILLELLNQMDGFVQNKDIKIITTTNHEEALDPALLRSGRLDRKIEFPLPDKRQKRLVFQTITSKMNLSEEIDLEDYVNRPDTLSGAEISAICSSAGLNAIREKRYLILPKDFEIGYKENVKKSSPVLDIFM